MLSSTDHQGRSSDEDANSVDGTTSTVFKIPSTVGTGGHEILAIDAYSRFPVTSKLEVN